MAKTKISEFSTTAGNNTDINSINIAEGCAPSGINDAIRELMRQLKEFQTGGAGDSVNSGGDFSVATNKFTVASASGNTAVAGTLAVTGTTTLTGALVANGNATLGDGSGDTVTVKGTPTLEVNPTLSGGTANGVLYLNGSKVATSGSALWFDGSNLGVGNNLATTVDNNNGSGKLVVGTGSGSQGMTIYSGSSSGNEARITFANSSTGSGSYSAQISYKSGDAAVLIYNNNAERYRINSDGTAIWSVAGSEAMRLTSTGLGIGTSSPGYKLDVIGSARIQPASGYNFLFQNSGTTARINYLNDAFSANVSAAYRATDFAWQKGDGSEVLKLDSSGNLLVACTSLPAGNRTKGFAARDNSTGGFQTYQTASSSDWAISASSGSICNFYSDNGSALVLAGQILVNGNITTYSSISDYRLKENVQPMVGALDKVQALKPVTYTFKNSGQISQGFIAHELAEVCPQAVTGEKDAVDENGNPKYQGIDTSFLVATLTAAIKEQQALIEQLTARVAALES